jgi:hypothetical protein
MSDSQPVLKKAKALDLLVAKLNTLTQKTIVLENGTVVILPPSTTSLPITDSIKKLESTDLANNHG